MKTRINNLFKINNQKLKDIIFNRYGFDKKDRKALNNVNINNESGGSGGATGGDEWKYYDISNLQANIAEMSIYFHLVKGINDNGNTLIMSFAAYNALSSYVACAVDLSAPIKDNISESIVTMDEYLTQMGAAELFPQIGITEITKEEFYTL